MDGNHVLIGAYRDDTNGANAGQVHLFDAATGALLNTFNSPNPMAFNFGRGVAIDGNFALLGADFSGVNGQHPGLGQAYLFNITTGDLVQTFDDPTITDWDTFGNFRTVAINGNRVLIGALGDDTNGHNVGQAYLFTAVADFNGDGVVDCVDVDSLVMEIVAGTNTATYDLTGEGLVNVADLDEWRVQGGAVSLPSGNPYLPGDANLDGVVDGSDFNVWNANKFSGTAAWCSGDFNADGSIDGSDFNIWNSNKFTSANAVAAVPEPVCPVVCHVVFLLFAVSWGRRRLGVS